MPVVLAHSKICSWHLSPVHLSAATNINPWASTEHALLTTLPRDRLHATKKATLNTSHCQIKCQIQVVLTSAHVIARNPTNEHCVTLAYMHASCHFSSTTQFFECLRRTLGCPSMASQRTSKVCDRPRPHRLSMLRTIASSRMDPTSLSVGWAMKNDLMLRARRRQKKAWLVQLPWPMGHN